MLPWDKGLEKHMRRMVYSGDPAKLPQTPFDVVIMGSGIAGLYAALNLDPALKVAVVSKLGIEKSNSWLAQGGIAAAISKDDKPQWHFDDTLEAGAGLCDHAAVRVLVDEGPENIRILQNMNVPFDVNDEGELQITREGGHHQRRIVHCGGDATGKETTRRLADIAASCPNITFLENSFLCDILTQNGAVCGALICRDGSFEVLRAPFLILASGGLGQLYAYTTNPPAATGDGIAAAMRAGAVIENMEFVQFHPTALMAAHEDEHFFLISEAVRGEGAILRNRNGEAFMKGQHPLADLAPRDIVARGIVREMNRTGAENVFLDASSMSEEFFSKRFPTIFAECRKRGIGVPEQWIPVRPVQHYFMGGVRTDVDGRTNIPGLYAAGEVACSGIHGANRLASNSVLECLVFGRRAALHINASPRPEQDGPLTFEAGHPLQRPHVSVRTCRARIQSTMTECGGIIRTQQGLEEGIRRMDELLETLEHFDLYAKGYMEVYNMALVARSILTFAEARKESIGGHYREEPKA